MLRRALSPSQSPSPCEVREGLMKKLMGTHVTG